MPPILALLIQTLLPIAVEEAKKKIAETPVVPVKPADPHLLALTNTLSGAVASKTIWVAAAIALLGYLESNQQFLTQYIGTDKMGLVMFVISGLMVVLRTVTTGSLGDKHEDTPPSSGGPSLP